MRRPKKSREIYPFKQFWRFSLHFDDADPDFYVSIFRVFLSAGILKSTIFGKI